jgi:hypothetical protein
VKATFGETLKNFRLPPSGARLLSSEFEKLKVQLIYGSLVGGHPPSKGDWLKRWQILFG